MKILLLTAAAILASLHTYAQGTASGVISFGNVGVTDDRRIWVNTTGNVNEGTRASGTGYQIALYYSPVQGAPEAALTQIGAPASFSPFGAGQFSGGNRTVTGLANPGDPVTVQARAWSYNRGIPNTYEAALAYYWAGGVALVGKGPVFVTDTFRPGDPTDPATSLGNDPGWRGFALFIPEPSVIAFGLLGVGALLLLRRRK